MARVCLPAAGAATLVHWGVLANQFAWDDLNRIAALSVPGVHWTQWILAPRGTAYAFHLLDRAVWGADPFGFHLTNLALHALASAAVGLTALTLTGSRRIALACGLLFAVHPVHVEAVACFTNRKEILALLGALASLHFYAGAGRSTARYVLSLACFTVALGAKEVAVVALPLALALSCGLRTRDGARVPWTRRAWRLAPFVLLALGAAELAVRADPAPSTPVAAHWLTAGRVDSDTAPLRAAAVTVPHVARLLLWPAELSVDYPTPAASPPTTRAVLGVLLVGAVSVLALLVRRRSPALSFGIAWTAILYLPVSNAVPLTEFYGAERFLYVPSFGVCLAVAALLGNREAGWGTAIESIIPVVIGVLVILGACRSVGRVREWRDDVTLARASLERGIETPRLHQNLAAGLWVAGDRSGCVRQLERGVALDPSYRPTRQALAATLYHLGDLRRAAAHCDTLLMTDPADSGAERIRAVWSLSAGDTARALAGLRRAVAADSSNAAALTDLAELLLRRSGASSPDTAVAIGLGVRAVRVAGTTPPLTADRAAVLLRELGVHVPP